jgi:hypothetical protein
LVLTDWIGSWVFQLGLNGWSSLGCWIVSSTGCWIFLFGSFKDLKVKEKLTDQLSAGFGFSKDWFSKMICSGRSVSQDDIGYCN